jgi:hypothetical protein
MIEDCRANNPQHYRLNNPFASQPPLPYTASTPGATACAPESWNCQLADDGYGNYVSFVYNPEDGSGLYVDSVSAASACVKPSYYCINVPGGSSFCIDSANGKGPYTILDSCKNNCAGITPTWDCYNNTCVDYGYGTGTFPTLIDCYINCSVTPTWNCIGSGIAAMCFDPMTGLGKYGNLSQCNDSCSTFIWGCTNPTACNYNLAANVNDGSCTGLLGCTNIAASNFNPLATCDDGSCNTSLTCSLPTTLWVTNIAHDRARFNWSVVNTASCNVDQIRIKYKDVNGTSWSQKNMGAPIGSILGTAGCNVSNTDKLALNLTPSTQYEYQIKVWYCDGTNSGYSAMQYFTTLDACPNVTNFAVTTPSTTKATFTWANAGVYDFVRIRIKVDSVGGGFTTAGGFGINYGILTKDKNGLTSGQAYKGWARTWCDPAGGPYRSASWTSPIYWSQPTSIRVDGSTAITNLDIYPNPSRDVFNITFISETIQDLKVRVLNVIGENIFIESKQQFVGEYTKQISLEEYPKAIYFLEIETQDRVINKKLILQ